MGSSMETREKHGTTSPIWPCPFDNFPFDNFSSDDEDCHVSLEDEVTVHTQQQHVDPSFPD